MKRTRWPRSSQDGQDRDEWGNTPFHHAEKWYDRSLRLWTVMAKDTEGNQMGAARYATSRKEADADIAVLERHYAEQTQRLTNPGPRAVARAYVQRCGWKKSEVLALTGKKWKKGMASPRTALSPDAQRVLHRALAAGDVGAGCAAVLSLCLCFGLRIAEATTLTVANVKATGLHVFGKGSKWRMVPFAVCPEGRKVVGVLRREPLASAGACQRACRMLTRLHPELRALTPHVLRHTFATEAVRRCVDPQALQAALGHDKFATTVTYLQGIGAL